MSDMEDIMRRAFGIGMTLDEWKEKFKDRTYVEYKNVKSLNAEEVCRFSYNKNMPILMVMESSHWSPKYTSGWAGGEESGCDIDNYGLTDEEIVSTLNECEEFKNGKIRFKNILKGGTQTRFDEDGTKIVINDPHCQKLVTSERYASMSDCLKKLKEFSNIRFKEKETTKNYSYYIDDEQIKYTSQIKETSSEYKEFPTYAFYIFDENGKYVNAMNYGALYG